MNTQALELNEIIKKNSQTVFSLLSERGRNIFFPQKGILAQTAEARGKKINATIGEAIEDDGTPMRLKTLENKINISPALVFPYATSSGRMDFRNRWKSMLYEKNPELTGKEISLPVITSGLTHGLNITGYMFLSEIDTLIIPDLSWENYELIFSNSYGCSIKTTTLFHDNTLDLKSLRKTLTKDSKSKIAILLNYPNNPSGYMPSIREAAEIVSIIKDSAEKGNKILVIIDDAYFGLVYEEDAEKESLFSYLSDIHENVLAVKLDGPTKEDYVWGFRVGCITYGIKNGNKALYDALELKTAGAIRGSISNASNLSQSILNNAYNSPTYSREKLDKYEILKTRYRILKNVLDDNYSYSKVFKPLPFNSGYFMCIKPAEGIDCEEVRKLLLEEFDTGIINMSGVLRIAYSCVSENKIPQLFENIFEACVKVKK